MELIIICISIPILIYMAISMIIYDVLFQPLKRPLQREDLTSQRKKNFNMRIEGQQLNILTDQDAAKQHPGSKRITHELVFEYKIPVEFTSCKHKLLGYLYGVQNKKGIIILAHGIGNSSNYYIPEILYFTEQGYQVFCFDYSCYWENEGKHFAGILQATLDLNNAIEFISKRTSLPITLFGHSLGGFAVCSVLNLTDISIQNVICFAGFNNASELIQEMLTRRNKFLGLVISPSILMIQKFRFGKLTHITAVDGLNKNNVKAMIIHGTKDNEIDIHGSAIFAKQQNITNGNVVYRLCEEEGLNTHMGIIRKDNSQGELNHNLLEEIITFIQ